MGYNEELQQKLDEVRVENKESSKKYDVNSVDERIVDELHEEFDLSQYDLHESDILRAIKIESVLSQYNNCFSHPYSLKTFYAIAKATSLNINSLFKLINLQKNEFLELIKEFRYSELIATNAHNEVELTTKGKAFAKELGIDIFI